MDVAASEADSKTPVTFTARNYAPFITSAAIRNDANRA